MPGFNLADLFERTAAAVPDREALVAPSRRLTYAQLDRRAERMAAVLLAHGVRASDHVGILALNGTEWLETFLAVCKVRAAAVNVNHRYVADELRHVCADSGLVVLVHHRRFGPRVDAIRADLPCLRQLVTIDDDSGEPRPADAIDYEEALAGAPAWPVADRDDLAASRSGDDRYVIYTGGTTGLPKGVVWRHEDFFFAALGGGGAGGLPVVTRPDELAERAVAMRHPLRWLLPAPLHHAGGQWGTTTALLTGHTVVLWTGVHFDADAIWRLVERERVQSLGLIGDAMARPLADALAAPGASYDLSSLLSVGSGGALFSPAVKEDLKRLLPHVILAESLGSSESGLDAVTFLEDRDLEAGARARFALGPHLGVFDDDLRPVAPGSGAVGRLARRGHIPVGYHNDPARTAATFPVIDGERWVMPGDHALVDADGTVHLLGRGSVCINTGGEKVWAEEVEAVLKRHPAVYDAVVVGVPDPRWGQQVAAAVQLRAGRQIADDDELARHCRSFLAGYKVPRRVRVVDEVVRHPSGKPDYRWAAAVAANGA